ncbi:hypothetical protein KRMM14A1004_04670 [Krasilnikovia sp. MM14-A1004]
MLCALVRTVRAGNAAASAALPDSVPWSIYRRGRSPGGRIGAAKPHFSEVRSSANSCTPSAGKEHRGFEGVFLQLQLATWMLSGPSTPAQVGSPGVSTHVSVPPSGATTSPDGTGTGAPSTDWDGGGGPPGPLPAAPESSGPHAARAIEAAIAAHSSTSRRSGMADPSAESSDS